MNLKQYRRPAIVQAARIVSIPEVRGGVDTVEILDAANQRLTISSPRLFDTLGIPPKPGDYFLIWEGGTSSVVEKAAFEDKSNGWEQVRGPLLG